MKLSNLLFSVVLILQYNGGETTSCPNISATADTKPLYLLTLASIPDDLTALSGACIARDEINNHTDLLAGYHIELIVDTIEGCSSFEAGIGLSNLVKYTVSPPCRPVVAVNGLGCSSHTSLLSPVAGHDGYDLIQLSSANSPIFQTQNHRFPHLWRFLGSATVHSDTILAIMDQYNWNRIGVVFDVESVLYSGIANDIEQRVKAANKTIVFILEMKDTKGFYLNAAISNIKSQQTTILVSLLNLEQEAALLHQAFDENLVYPDYTWIHVERLPQNLNPARGHIYLHTQTTLKPDTVLASGKTFAEFKGKHSEDIKLIEQQYKLHFNLTPSVFASYWYDQVWAIALAMNNSFPVLENRNLSIDNYTIGQREITDVIEEQMANLSFQGAGGWVEFNQYRSVSTPVEIYWVTENGTVQQVGIFNPKNKHNLSFSIKKSKLPNDRLPPEIIALPVAILLYLISGIVSFFISLQLILFLYYRNHKTVKATSPHLSLLIYIGCYITNLACLLSTIFGSIHLPSIFIRNALTGIAFLILVNGISLILVTIVIRLLRVYRIFILTERQKIGKYWKNAPLILIVVSVSLTPNVFSIVYVGILRSFVTLSVYIGLTGAFLYLNLIIILFLAIRTRKIKYKDFKDTKTITSFIATMLVTMTIVIPTSMIFIAQDNLPAAYIARVLAGLVTSATCQLLLFAPKLFRIVIENCFSSVQLPFFSTIVTTKSTTMQMQHSTVNN